MRKLIKPDSLSKKWIAQHLRDEKNPDSSKMEQAMENTSESVLDWINSAFGDENSMYRKRCTVVMHYGKSNNPNFKHSVADVEGVLWDYSNRISWVKRNSSTNTESQNLASVLRIYITMLGKNSSAIPAGHCPTFSHASGTKNYRENDKKRETYLMREICLLLKSSRN